MPWTTTLVRRDADRARVALVALARSGSRPARRMKSSAMRSSSRGRDRRARGARRRGAIVVGDERAGARDPVDLGRALADDHAAPPSSTQVERLLDLRVHRLDRAVGVERDELAGGAVALDDRRGLLVVELRGAARSPRARRRRAPPRRRAQRAARARCSSARSKNRIASRSRPISASIASSASACARLRGNPSSTNPCAASGSASRSRISAIVSSSGTSSPAARIGSTCAPSSRAGLDRGAEHVAGRDVRDPVARRRSASPGCPCRSPAARERAGSSAPTSGSPRRCASSSATPSDASCRARHRRRSAPTCRRARRRWPARSRRSG